MHDPVTGAATCQLFNIDAIKAALTDSEPPIYIILEALQADVNVLVQQVPDLMGLGMSVRIGSIDTRGPSADHAYTRVAHLSVGDDRYELFRIHQQNSGFPVLLDSRGYMQQKAENRDELLKALRNIMASKHVVHLLVQAVTVVRNKSGRT